MALLNSTSSDNLPLDLDPDFCFSMAEFDLEEFSSEDLFQDDSYHNGFLDLSPAICHDDQNLSDLNDSYFSDSKSFQNPDTSRPTLLMPNRGSYSHNFVEESSDTTPTSDEYLSISDSNILEKHPDDFSSELSDRDIKPSYLYSNWEEKSILNANHADNLNHASITNKVFVERRPGLVKHGTSFSRLERLSHNTPQQQPSITISLSNGIGSSTYDNASNTASSTVNNASNNSNLLRSRQQCGVMSGRIKKKDAYFPLIHIKRSPSQSPLPSEDGSYYHDSQQHTSAFHNSSATSLRMRSQGNGQRHYPVTSLSSSTASGNVSLTRTNLLRPISSSNASSNGACFKLGSNYRSDANQMLSSSGMNDNCDASTCSSGSSTRGGNGRGASPSASSLFQNSLCGQSDLLPITEEEIRVMTCEGYPIPSSLPLTKADEKNLKKVRRKIKNKRSAQESRRKKKEYVERLEKHADALAQENIVLRRRLEEMERRVELSEVRNRQLVNRLCKNGNGTTTNNNNNNNPGGNGKCDSSTSANNANNIRSNHLQPHGRTYSPPSSTTATMNSANSTKFYIVAFVLLFSVLFAGDPTILMRGVDSPLGGGAGGVGLRYYSLSRIHKLDAGGFRSFFCPAGIYHCRYGTSKVSNEVAYMRNKKTRWLPRLRHASDESPPGPWKPVVPHATLARVNHSATAKTEPSFDSRRSAAYLPQPFSTKSMLLDAHDVEDGSTECSLSNFWKNLWYSEATVVESSENELWMTDSIRHGAPVVLLNASSLSHFVNIANLSDDTLLLVESKQNVADHANGVIRLLSDSVTFLTA